MAGYSHRTAQPLILATFLSWGGSAGAGRVRPAAANVVQMKGLKKPIIAHFKVYFAWNLHYQYLVIGHLKYLGHDSKPKLCNYFLSPHDPPR